MQPFREGLELKSSGSFKNSAFKFYEKKALEGLL